MFEAFRKRMQVEIQRLQDPSQVNGDSPDSVRRKSKIHFRRGVGGGDGGGGIF